MGLLTLILYLFDCYVVNITNIKDKLNEAKIFFRFELSRKHNFGVSELLFFFDTGFLFVTAL